MSLPADRRSSLLASKLRVLVADRWAPEADLVAGSFPAGATLVDPDEHRAWILIDEDAEHRLGGAMAVARRSAITDLHLIIDDPRTGGIVARRAALLANPPTVWRAEGRVLVPVDPAPPAVDVPPAPEAELYRPVLVAAGLDPVVEGGNLVGELLGLEVARVVVDPDGSAHVEAGVGRFDREVGAMMFAELGETDAVARAVDIVRRSRVADAERHPLNHLVPERWLRSAVIADPSLVGATELRPVGSAVPRQNLTEQGVASAVGTDTDGLPLVVCCSTGVYLDLVPSAADDRLTHAPDARLVLAVPERDGVPVTLELAEMLAQPAEVIRLHGDWREPAGLS